MAPSLLAPDVPDKILSGKTNAKKMENTKPECEYTRDEKQFMKSLESSFKVGTNISFLRPKVLSGCINLAHQAHNDYNTLDPEIRKKILGSDNEMSLENFLKVRTKSINWDDPMAKCDFDKIVNDDSLKSVLDSCNVCSGKETGDYKFLNIMSCYSNVNKLDVVKMEMNNNS